MLKDKQVHSLLAKANKTSGCMLLCTLLDIGSPFVVAQKIFCGALYFAGNWELATPFVFSDHHYERKICHSFAGGRWV
jgi:hypothetical protein